MEGSPLGRLVGPERWFDGRFGSLVLAVALVCTSAMGWLLFRSMHHPGEGRELARDMERSFRTLEALENSFARAESAQLAYLLTRDSRFEQERGLAIGELRSWTQLTQAISPDSPIQQARARELQDHVERGVNLLLAPATVRADPDAIQAAAAARSRVWHLGADMLAHEVESFHAHEQAHARTLRVEVPVLGALVLASLLGLLLTYRRGIVERGRRLRLQRKMSEVLTHLPVTAWQLRTLPDGKHRFDYVSPTVEASRGIAADALYRDAEAAFGMIHEEDRVRIRQAALAAERELAPFQEKYRVRHEDAVRWVEACATLQREADGSTLWNGFWRDITDEMQLQHKLQFTSGELDSFSYSVAHDLRTPMAAIAAFSRAIHKRAGASLDAQSKEDLARISEAVAETIELIEVLLGLGRLSRQQLQREQVDLSHMAATLVAGLREHHPERRCEIEIEPDLTAHGDRALLRQVLANLIENAWKFTSRVETARIHVGSAARACGEKYFFVCDNGAGFDASRAERLFEAFHRMHRSDDFPGTGIGLATVKRIVVLHGGEIWCESAPGQGATFYFTLPA